jgi:hypothetical protein
MEIADPEQYSDPNVDAGKVTWEGIHGFNLDLSQN